MIPSIRCPSCTRPLGQIDDDGCLQAKCLSCHRSFGVVYGKLCGCSSRWEAILYLTAKLPSFYKRRYEFRLATPGRDLKVLRFSTPGREDRVPVSQGDRLSLLYSTQGSVMQKLISVNNHTLGKTFYLPAPIPSSAYLLRLLGAISLGMILCIFLTDYGLWLTIGLGAIALLVTARSADAAQLTTPVLQPQIRAEARLIGERKLLLQKLVLSDRIEFIRQEGLENRALIQRLSTLQGKMQNLNATLYHLRIQQVERAVGLLQQRTQHDRHLTEQYAQTIRMIEIELETAYLADQLPDAHDFSGAILGKLAELQAIETHNDNLRLELEANAEVRRLSLD